jgi:hypothetical protein
VLERAHVQRADVDAGAAGSSEPALPVARAVRLRAERRVRRDEVRGRALERPELPEGAERALVRALERLERLLPAEYLRCALKAVSKGKRTRGG